MENLTINLKLIFNFATIIVYFFGLTTFGLTLLADWLSDKRELRPKNWYIQEFLYTTISIFLGMFVCLAFESNQNVIYIVGIIMGLTGSSIIRKVIARKDEIADKVVDKMEDKIS